jgi:cell division initiation protein
MITPQEISGKEFDTVAFGGYNKGLVEDFISVVAEDYEKLYKENTVLKNKMKTLADKVEEYRNAEDSMQKAIFAAQRIAQELQDDARQKHDQLIEEAETVARQRIEALKVEIRDQEYRLDQAKKATAEFTAGAELLLTKYSTFLSHLNQLSFAVPAVIAVQQSEIAKTINASVVKQIEENESRATAATTVMPVLTKLSYTSDEDDDVKKYISGS